MNPAAAPLISRSSQHSPTIVGASSEGRRSAIAIERFRRQGTSAAWQSRSLTGGTGEFEGASSAISILNARPQEGPPAILRHCQIVQSRPSFRKPRSPILAPLSQILRSRGTHGPFASWRPGENGVRLRWKVEDAPPQRDSRRLLMAYRWISFDVNG
jgi:hypothetical protein